MMIASLLLQVLGCVSGQEVRVLAYEPTGRVGGCGHCGAGCVRKTENCWPLATHQSSTGLNSSSLRMKVLNHPCPAYALKPDHLSIRSDS